MTNKAELGESGRLKSFVAGYYRAFRSPTIKTVCNYYIPTGGVISYLALSANVMNPNWISSAAYKRSTTDLLLVGAIVGSGTYIYNRQIVAQAPTHYRVLYSGVGSVLFSFGSVLAWAITRTYVPNSSALSTLAGLALGVLFLGVCDDFCTFLDAKTTTSPSVEDRAN